MKNCLFLVFYGLLVFNKSIANSDLSTAANYLPYTLSPFPQQLVYLEKEFYKLLDDSETANADLTRQFNGLLKSAKLKDPLIRKKLLGGPESKGRFMTTRSNSNYVYFDLCQAHQCNITKLGLLYDPDKKETQGLLRITCEDTWLGKNLDKEKKAILIGMLGALEKADKDDCESERAKK